MPDGIENCIGEVIAAAGGALSRADAQGILQGLDDRAARIGDLDQAAREMNDEARMAALIEKRNALLNRAAREERRARILENARTLGKDGKLDLATAVRNQVVAINTPTKGGRFSAEARWKTRQRQYVDGMVGELKKKGLLAAVRSGEFEADWARELYERSMQAAGEDAHPGVTGNKVAADIAEVVHRYQSWAKENLNRTGAWIGDYAGYITRTMHDQNKMRRAGRDAWVAGIMDKLDQARTFEGVDDPAKMMRGVYDALQTGVHLDDSGGVGMKDPAFTGPGNAAKKASAGRVLHFKDAASWYAYQREFGSGTLFEQALGGLERSARQEAMMARWGTNPRAEFDQDMQWLAEQHRSSDPAAVIRLKDKEHSLQTLFGYLDGSANRPANMLASQIASDIRTVKSMASLGAVAFTHLSAGVTKAAELRYQGVGFFDRYSNFLASMVKGRGRGEERELSDLMLAGMEGAHGRILNRFQADDTIPGTLSKVANRYFQATGLTYLLDAQKAGAMRVMSRHLGMMADRGFEALPPQTRRALMQYDISPAEWEALRSAPDHTTVDGRVHLTPDAAHRATPDSVYGVMGAGQGELPGLGSEAAVRAEAKARDAMALKLQAYYSDVADRSIITPGIADKALILGGNRPGTVVGEALRFTAQFKTWGTAAARQGIGRELYGGQGGLGAASGVMQMAVASALMGYGVMTLKDLTSGKDPRPVNDYKAWLAALIQGGGFGILGDYLFGEYGRTGGDWGSTVLGPVVGDAGNSVIALWNDAKDAADDPRGRRLKDMGPDALHIAKEWTPFVNLFYARVAVQYGLLNQINEVMSPGYLRRIEQRAKREQNQTYWLSPSTGQARMPHMFGG